MFFSENIKFLRERKKINQEDLAAQLEIGRSKLNALENGQTKAPAPEDYVRFSEYFKISIDALLKIKLRGIPELKLRELEAGNDIYLEGRNLRVLAITVDSRNAENVEYVSVKSKAGYLAGFQDPEFIASLPRYSFPNLPQNGSYRIFPITGDSMLPITSGSEIIAKFIQDWSGIKPQTPCIVVSGEQDLVFKLVTLQHDGTLLLESLNEVFEPYTVPIEEVQEIWSFYSFISYDMPKPNQLAYISKTVQEIKDRLIG